MQKMIRDILIFSRVGREEVRTEKVDCNAVLAETLREFEDVIADKQAAITAGPLPMVLTSPTLVRVLFQNLIGNALKFQPAGAKPEISISALASGSMWRFEVKDNGIGIDPAFSERVFTIFQRLHRVEEYPGTGIGLSTCKKFLRLVGGDITFTSKPGERTTFVFTLPAK
jgi:light-regulated signal transduction histidine kinase (bacteriophytochrome)